MPEMDELAFALKMRDVVSSLVQEELQKQRPRYRYATVTSVDVANHRANVIFNGDTAAVTVATGQFIFAKVNDIVRIDGIGPDKFISDIIGWDGTWVPATINVNSTPSAPSTGKATIFVKSIGGRAMPASVAPAGEDYAFQPHFGGKTISRATPIAGSTSVSSDGIALTATGTATAATPASTNLFATTKRVEYLVTVAATTAVAGAYSPVAYLWRGNAARLGGFHFQMTGGPATGITNTTDRFFMGLAALVTAPTDAQPSAMINMVGIGWDAADATVQLFTNDATGTATKVSLATLTKAAADRTAVYQLDLYCPPNGSNITYVVTDVTNNVSVSGTISTDLPANTAFLAPRIYTSVGGTSSVTGVALMNLYTESDN